MMKKFIAVSAVGLVAATPTDTKDAFVKFMKKFGKQYEAEELIDKFTAFEASLKKIEEHNKKGGDYAMSVNQFSDLSGEEFAALHKGYNHRENAYIRSLNQHVPSDKPIADDIDWVTKGAVTPIKNQGQCGSCWSFSTTGSVEGAHQIKTGSLVSLSEQELVDCAGAEGNQGCGGGLMDDAFQYIIANKGLTTEASYPYKGKDGSCNNNTKLAVTISSFKDIKKSSEDDLMSALQLGPVSIAVDAMSWQFYGSGVMKWCIGKKLDHGVLLVGSGTDNGVDYWKIKNSWGESWGEKGYIRVKRGHNACGLADAASYPIV